MKKEIVISLFVLFVSLLFFFVNYFNPINIAPLKRALNSVVDFSRSEKLQKENEALREEIIKIRHDAAKYELTEKENKELKTLLDIKNTKNYKKTYCQVVAQSFAGNIHITVNKGKMHNIKKGDIAVFGTALVGRVEEVFPQNAKITPVGAPGISAGAVVSRTKAYGYTEGSRDSFLKNEVTLYLFGTSDFAAAGDKILTSGLGTAYPEGLILGNIVDSTDKKTGCARVLLYADVISLRNLCILSEVDK